MPTQREREYYRMGFLDGQRSGRSFESGIAEERIQERYRDTTPVPNPIRTTKRKLSAWNKYVKANSKKPRFRYRNGKLNLKKMAVAFRKTPAGKKKRR
jgi:hypothetical protein